MLHCFLVFTLCFGILISVPKIVTIEHSVCSMDGGYIRHSNQKWYKVFNDTRTNCAARVACNKDNARLAMLKTEEDVILHNDELTSINIFFFPKSHFLPCQF